MHPGDQRDHGDQCLSERRREQRACHPMWLEARHNGTDDSDGEHPDIHQVDGVFLISDDANSTVHPEKDECGGERKTYGGSVHGIAYFYR